jgi:glycosyltransferase involved in cell wall biosynthesis
MEGAGRGQVEILVNGVPSGEPVTTVCPAREAPVHWWTLLELDPATAPGRAVLELRTDDGVDVQKAELGTIATESSLPRHGADTRRLSEAMAAAGEEDLIAICMATYEPRIDLFRSQVSSIKDQTHTGWICVISDDGSSPERLAEMEEAIGGDPRFVFLENEDRVGFYANFERALAAVPPQARFVALADQDDLWYPDKLEALVAALGDRDLAYSDMRIVRDDGELMSDTYWSLRRNNYTDLASLLVGNTVTGAVTLFRADLLSRVLPFPPRRGKSYHDHWIALMAMTGRGISYVDRPLQDYVQHGEAAQGHEEANAGAGYLQLRMLLGLAWQALGALLGRPTRKGWASRYFEMYLRTVMWAKVALMRSSSLDRRQERILRRVVNSDSSPASLFWLAGRSLRPIWGANEAFGRELLLLSSVAWMWSLKIRSRIGSLPRSSPARRAR